MLLCRCWQTPAMLLNKSSISCGLMFCLLTIKAPAAPNIVEAAAKPGEHWAAHPVRTLDYLPASLKIEPDSALSR